MIGQLKIGTDGEIRDKVEDAINFLKYFEPEEGYFLAFSGGKDSQCIYHLAKMAGVKFDAHYAVTSVDPPDLVWFIRNNYPDVHMDVPHDDEGKRISMWSLIVDREMPPTMIQRYCCEELKECFGKNRVTVTGVRWAESAKRKTNQGKVNFIGKKKNTEKIATELDVEYRVNKSGNIILNSDNEETREMVERCYRNRKTVLNPIIEWTEDDVWEFLNTNGIEHCCLYDEGFARIGCIGCPMARRNRAERDFTRYPKYKTLYLHAFDRMLKRRKESGKETTWKTAEDVMRWWLMDEDNDSDTQVEI